MEKFRYIFTLSLFLISSFTLGQDLLTLNGIVPMEGFSSEALMQNADAYFSKVPERIKGKKKIKQYLENIIREENSVAAPKDAMVYSRNLAKHTLGRIEYIYKVEVKDNKYRYSFNSIHYIPFERDRYGKFVPVPGKKYTHDQIVNNSKFRYRKDILASVNEYLESQSSKLYIAMMEFPTAENEVNETEEDW